MSLNIKKSSSVSEMSGMRFGKLTVLEYAGLTNQGDAKWLYECECGKITTPSRKNLLAGKSRSCGCDAPVKKTEKQIIRETGKTYGRFTVLRFVGDNGKRNMWEAQCECGKVETRTIGSIKKQNAMCADCKKVQTSEVRTVDSLTFSNNLAFSMIVSGQYEIS